MACNNPCCWAVNFLQTNESPSFIGRGTNNTRICEIEDTGRMSWLVPTEDVTDIVAQMYRGDVTAYLPSDYAR